MSPETAPLDAEQLGAYFALMEVSSLLQHAVEEHLRADGDLSYVQFQILARLTDAQPPLLEQLAAAFATHNDALVPDDDLGRRLVRTIAHPAIAFASDPAAADIDALLFAGPPDQADSLRRTLAARDGAIVPLIRTAPTAATT